MIEHSHTHTYIYVCVCVCVCVFVWYCSIYITKKLKQYVATGSFTFSRHSEELQVGRWVLHRKYERKTEGDLQFKKVYEKNKIMNLSSWKIQCCLQFPEIFLNSYITVLYIFRLVKE